MQRRNSNFNSLNWSRFHFWFCSKNFVRIFGQFDFDCWRCTAHHPTLGSKPFGNILKVNIVERQNPDWSGFQTVKFLPDFGTDMVLIVQNLDATKLDNFTRISDKFGFLTSRFSCNSFKWVSRQKKKLQHNFKIWFGLNMSRKLNTVNVWIRN